jgi:hypothetical protein
LRPIRANDQGFQPLSLLFKRIAIQEMGSVELLAERVLFVKGDVEMAARLRRARAGGKTPGENGDRQPEFTRKFRSGHWRQSPFSQLVLVQVAGVQLECLI